MEQVYGGELFELLKKLRGEINDFIDGLTLGISMIVLAFGLPMIVVLFLKGYPVWALFLEMTYILSAEYMDEI